MKLFEDFGDVSLKMVSVATTIGAIMAFMGFMVLTPKQQLEIHAVQSQVIHDSLRMQIKTIESRQDKYEFLIDAIIRGECIKNSKDDLAKQGLIQKCKEEGIDK